MTKRPPVVRLRIRRRPVGASRFCSARLTRGWQKAPAPGYMPLPLVSCPVCGAVVLGDSQPSWLGESRN